MANRRTIIRRASRGIKHMAGFTLIEMCLAVAIILILAGIALYNFNNSKAAVELNTNIEELFADLKYTRSLGMSRGSTVINLSSNGYNIQVTESGVVKTKKNKVFVSHLSLSVSPSSVTAITFRGTGACDYNAVISLTSSRMHRAKTITVSSFAGEIIKN